MPRAAVVIGVDKTGDLPVLNDAAAGAVRVAAWLTAEGYDVTALTDTDKTPVLVSGVFSAIETIVSKGVYEQLVIYFSGHGYLNDGSEHWLLSNAPANPNEAISLDENIDLARDCGIPNVIFISDACRSTPGSLKADRVRGSMIFPNNGIAGAGRADVDRFFACLPGNPSFEVPVDKSTGQYSGLYTASLRHAHENTPQTQTEMVGGIEVLTNRKLKKLLPALVDAAARQSSKTLFQKPDTIVESEPDIFIAKVQRSAPAASAQPEFPPSPSPGLQRALPSVPAPAGFFRKLILPDPIAITRTLRDHAEDLLAEQMGIAVYLGLPPIPDLRLRGAIDLARQQSNVTHFETGCGFALRGVRVAAAAAIGCTAEILGYKNNETAIRVTWSAPPPAKNFDGTVLIRFEDGAGVVLAALPDYIGTVIVDYDGGGKARTDGVTQITYTPSGNTARWPLFEKVKTRVDDMRALVSGLARNGVFRVDKDQAAVFASHLDTGGAFDPTLSLYAAYALNDIGLRDGIETITTRLRDDLNGTTLYDLALLGRPAESPDTARLVPFCPMLSRGWPLTRTRKTPLSETIREAGQYRRATLWTTFDAAGMDLLFNALTSGLTP